MTDLLERIDERLDEMDNKANMKKDFFKALKVIHSVQNKGQAESARKFVENFYSTYSIDMSPFKKLDLYTDKEKLLKGLKDHMQKRLGVKLSNRELGLI
jgi:hypothetical protein